jgi:acyl-CoA thioesterase
MAQGDRVIALGLAAFATPRDAPGYDETKRPVVPAPEDVDALVPRMAVGFFERFEFRQVIGGPPLSGTVPAESGVWMRLREPSTIDAPLVATLADAWTPVPLARLTEPAFYPTIDLTVHFRAPMPVRTEFTLGVFRSTLLADGFFEEDGELWTESGELVAHCRQLALVVPGATAVPGSPSGA